MKYFFAELKKRNGLLFWFGCYNIIIALVCAFLISVDDAEILGVSRWLKPMKFYVAVSIMVFTMGWLLYYLSNTKRVKQFTRLIIFTMFFENGLILLQAIRKTISHFNIKTTFDNVCFQLMGVLILIFTFTAISITVAFFRQKKFSIAEPYLWGIRLGLVFFILSSLEAGVMLALLKHTVGAPDGTPGLPIINWSKNYGDLRIAHFVGIHALQILPLLGFYVTKTKNQIAIVAVMYFIFAAALLFQALKGIPLFF